MQTSNETPLTINQIQLAIADSILAQQGGIKTWGMREHTHAIRKLAERYGLPAESAKQFHACLLENGFGSNASQFRQWISKPALARLTPKANPLDDYI